MSRFDAPLPTREQLRNILAVALGSRQHSGPRPLSTYDPLAWLLRDDAGNRPLRGIRREVYLKLVRDLAREFDRIYAERLTASNGPWDFPAVYVASRQARKGIRRMRWCAFEHMLHLPGVNVRSTIAYKKVMELFIPAADLNIA